MRPIKFKEVNKELLKPAGMATSCGTLPVYNNGEVCISLWKASFRERIGILITGKLWLQVRSGNTQPPVSMGAEKPFE